MCYSFLLPFWSSSKDRESMPASKVDGTPSNRPSVAVSTIDTRCSEDSVAGLQNYLQLMNSFQRLSIIVLNPAK